VPEFEVYSRRGCHLCEVLVEALAEQLRGRAEFIVHDVDARLDWQTSYGDDVPVVTFGGREVCRHRLDADAVAAAPAARR
jgi:hypothetical protein